MLPELTRAWIPAPSVVLTGCQAWPPAGHVGTCCLGCGAAVDVLDPRCAGCGTRIPLAGGPCPVHGERIRGADDRTYCGWCDAMSEANEHRVMTARIGIAAHTRSERAESDALKYLRRKARGRTGAVELSESERRRIWNGYRNGIVQEDPELTNRAKIGREFLRSIGQEPRWHWKLNRSGRVVGETALPGALSLPGGVAV